MQAWGGLSLASCLTLPSSYRERDGACLKTGSKSAATGRVPTTQTPHPEPPPTPTVLSSNLWGHSIIWKTPTQPSAPSSNVTSCRASWDPPPASLTSRSSLSEPRFSPLNCGLEDRKTEGRRESISSNRDKDRETGRTHVDSSKGHQSATLMLGEAGDGRTDRESVGSCLGQGPGLNYKRGFIQMAGDLNPKPVQ